jgi:hypothetical protein
MRFFYYHWIPDIFPEIQEKFRDDGASHRKSTENSGKTVTSFTHAPKPSGIQETKKTWTPRKR